MVTRRFALGTGTEKNLLIAFHFLQLAASATPTEENNLDEAVIEQAKILLRNTAYPQAWSIRFNGPMSLSQTNLICE
jgi:hypothetical protein